MIKRVCVIGGGPGGLYAALLLKKQEPNRHVVLYEKNPADATYGWGVVFSDRTLTSFREADLQTYEDIIDTFVMWDAIDVRMRDAVIRCEGQVFSGIARKELLALLQQRCADLGVELHWETEITHTDLAGEFDLVVAADGVHSLFRETFERELKPTITEGASRYIWFGTDRSFDSFTFCFRETEFGLFQAHAYPFEGTTGTFIVECRPEVWRRAGLDRSSEQESIAFCQKVFESDLLGASLMSNSSKWLTFPTLKCKRWSAGNTVFIGDAIHTAHFSIGSGTKLAMEDAIGLAEACRRNEGLDDALGWYEMDRRPRVENFQEAARQSQSYFENTARYLHMDPLQFAFNLLTRSGRVGYGDIRLKDPRLVAGVDSLLSGAEDARTAIAPPPAFNPMPIRGDTLAGRLALTLTPTDDATDGVLSDQYLERAARGGNIGSGTRDYRSGCGIRRGPHHEREPGSLRRPAGECMESGPRCWLARRRAPLACRSARRDRTSLRRRRRSARRGRMGPGCRLRRGLRAGRARPSGHGSQRFGARRERLHRRRRARPECRVQRPRARLLERVPARRVPVTAHQ